MPDQRPDLTPEHSDLNAASRIIDLGMHTGQDTAFYLKKGFRVLAVEADPELIAQAESRFADAIGDGRLELVHAAVAEHDGETGFYRSKAGSLYNTLMPDRLTSSDEGYETITVPSIAAETLLERAGLVRYLKIDIEGADDFVLGAVVRRAEFRPAYVSAEGNGPELAALLYAAGYRGFKLVNQARFARWRQPDPPLEGVVADHAFELHSSGLFGEESPGAWVSFKEVTKQWAAAARLMSLNTELFNAWFDVHARLDAGDGG